MLCIHCERFSDALLCPLCTKELEEQAYASLYSQRCPTCGRPLLDRAYPCLFCLEGFEAYAPYTNLVHTLLHRFKAEERKVLAKVFANLYIPMLSQIEKPLLIPVPASGKGVKQRGFDQMLLISTLLAKKTGYPCMHLFVQTGETQSKFLSRVEREGRHTIKLLPPKKNVEKLLKEGYTCVLLDDICTTGSTLATCKALIFEQFGVKAFSLVMALV